MSNLVIETSDPTVRFGKIPVYGLTKKSVEDVINNSKVLPVEQIEMIQKSSTSREWRDTFMTDTSKWA